VNSHEAKQILLLYRPAIDRDAPEFADAIALTRSDVELNAWFEQHCAFQNAASSAFNGIRIPEGLKEQILSERKAHFTLTSQRRMLVAACAMAVIAFCSVFTFRSIFPPKPSLDYSFGNFQTNMIATIIRYPGRMDLETNDLQALRQNLAEHGQSNLVFTAALNKTAGTGCKKLDWQDKTVAMVCFNSGKNGNPKKPDLFLFVVDKTAIKGPPEAGPEVKQVRRGLVSSSWTSGDKTYVLAGWGNEEFLKPYLPGA
jgi:hypothetical protein